MTPNAEQLLAIKQYLNKHLRYRETEAEIYDHILTALEHVPANIPFGDAMNNVISNIGGLKGIALIERTAKTAAIRALMKSYIETLKQICASPFIMVIAVLTIVGYYVIKRFLFTDFSLMLTMMFMLNISTFAVRKRILKKANLINIKNDAFKMIYQVLGMLTPGIMCLLVVVRIYGSKEFFPVAAPFIVTATFCIGILNASVLYKLTRKEFRVKLMDV
jgi:hypothetical protein